MTAPVTTDSPTVELSHPDKVLFPDDGITKQELADYFRDVAEFMLPHVRDRPMTLQRFPSGIGEPGFFQKEAPSYLPEWMDTVTFALRDEGREQRQILCNSAATLAYMANQGTITQHVWLSRADRLEYPDRMIFDLDPAEEDFGIVKFAANTLRAKLKHLGIPAFPMTTGSRGLHVVVPLDRSADFDTVRAWAAEFARKLAWSVPDSFTTELRKESRGDRLFIDYTRNAYGQTTVAPYTIRAKKGAPVATPVSWDELEDLESSQAYNLRNVVKHLREAGDPWKDIDRHAVRIKPLESKK
ncbi:non-homologous end-joining DNA ligase [Methanocella sp. MCL-LM]|uniref:non-homologous end-joining DNA ligase n=1 Tax=Methanocella sp. MCL-LM TaxID=3412035 RepID=UPI003C720CC9